jgi:hypothetical protein
VAALRRLLEDMQRWQVAQPRPVSQLPADLPDFQGRDEQVVRLREILTKGGGQATVTAIGGMGGVGKSALAVHVAHLLEKEAPDGRVFVDMGGRTGTRFAPIDAKAEGAPLTAVEAMVRVVKALDPEKQVAKEEDAARHAYRAALEGRRVLLLLDNAENSAQVRPLLDWRAPDLAPRDHGAGAPGPRPRRDGRGRGAGAAAQRARGARWMKWLKWSWSGSSSVAGGCRWRCVSPVSTSPTIRR